MDRLATAADYDALTAEGHHLEPFGAPRLRHDREAMAARARAISEGRLRSEEAEEDARQARLHELRAKLRNRQRMHEESYLEELEREARSAGEAPKEPAEATGGTPTGEAAEDEPRRFGVTGSNLIGEGLAAAPYTTPPLPAPTMQEGTNEA